MKRLKHAAGVLQLVLLMMLTGATAYSQPYSDNHMWGWHMTGGGWFGGLIWLLLAVVLVYILMTAFGRGERGGERDSESALDILKKRFAKGEISPEDYQRMKRDLSGD